MWSTTAAVLLSSRHPTTGKNRSPLSFDELHVKLLARQFSDHYIFSMAPQQ